MFLGFGTFGILGTIFWLWMLYDCIQAGGNKRSTWLWLLVFLNVLGALLYFVVEWLPNRNIPMPSFANRWTRRQELLAAEAEAHNIGKAYQYIKLGTLLAELQMPDRAATAFQTAYEKEPENPQVLWGLAAAEIARDRATVARPLLEKLLKIDPDHKRGDAALAYGEILVAQDEWETARSHLQTTIKKFPQPPVCLLLAEAEVRAGNSEAARDILEKMLFRMRGTYQFAYRRHAATIRKAEKLLKRLKREGAPAR